MIIGHGLAAAISLHRLVRPLRENIAEIRDLCLRIFDVRRDVCGIRDRTAADNGNLHVNFTPFPLLNLQNFRLCRDGFSGIPEGFHHTVC